MWAVARRRMAHLDRAAAGGLLWGGDFFCRLLVADPRGSLGSESIPHTPRLELRFASLLV